MIVGEVETAQAAVGWHEKAIATWREVLAAEPSRVDLRRLAGALNMYSVHLTRLGQYEEVSKATEESVVILDALRVEQTDDLDTPVTCPVR